MPKYINADETYDDMLTAMAMTGYQSRALSVIDRQPTADVASVVHAHWIEGRDNEKVFCSVCSIPINGEPEKIKKYFKFCFNCGSKMDGEVPER